MGFRYQRRIRTGRNSWINLSKSGASGSVRIGPVTFNSRGRSSFRIAPGLSYRGSGGCLVPMLIVAATTIAAALGFVGRRRSG
ncbi:MAG: DUF4236 domain-containing protein [Actinomycetota bacterium]